MSTARNHLEKLYKYLSASLFTELILLIVIVIAFIVSLEKAKKEPAFQLFPYYFAAFILMFCIRFSYVVLEHNAHLKMDLRRLDTFWEYVLIILETLAFLKFFHAIINRQKFRNLLRIVAILIFVLFIGLSITDIFKPIPGLGDKLFTIEILVLLAPCIYYFRILLYSKNILNLNKDPGFWVSTGLLFFLTANAGPVFIFKNIGHADYQLYGLLYSIVYIFYIIFFLMIIRGMYEV